MWIKKEGPDIIRDGIVEVISGSFLITNKEIIENRIIEELIISEDFQIKFDFIELGNLTRHYKHCAIIDTAFGFDFSGLVELIEYTKDQIKSNWTDIVPVIYLKGGDQCLLPHLMHNFTRVMFDVAKPLFLVSNNLKSFASATVFFFEKAESDYAWLNRLEESIREKQSKLGILHLGYLGKTSVDKEGCSTDHNISRNTP